MRPYYQDNWATIYHADCREVLPSLSDGFFDATITDPVWPNATAPLAGKEDPLGLFREICLEIPRLSGRLVVQLGCDSDPRFLTAVPESLPFIRSCWLEYARPHYKGLVMYGSDVAYVFGALPKRQGWTVLPGRFMSTHSNGKEADHPCPRKLQHVRWLVKWYGQGRVLDCFMGSGTTLVAAKDAGLPCVGIEIEERYCEIAANRLSQAVMDFGATPLSMPPSGPARAGVEEREDTL